MHLHFPKGFSSFLVKKSCVNGQTYFDYEPGMRGDAERVRGG